MRCACVEYSTTHGYAPGPSHDWEAATFWMHFHSCAGDCWPPSGGEGFDEQRVSCSVSVECRAHGAGAMPMLLTH